MSKLDFSMSVNATREINRYNTDSEGKKTSVARTLTVDNVTAEFPFVVEDEKIHPDSIADFKTVNKMTGDIVKITLTGEPDNDGNVAEYTFDNTEGFSLTSLKASLKAESLIKSAGTSRTTKADLEAEVKAKDVELINAKNEAAAAKEQQRLVQDAIARNQTGELPSSELFALLDEINGMSETELLVSAGLLTV